ncbi:hypothetical protein DIU38_007045 [Mucilaginibacter sp. P4]|uniref:hypothetical protein n=1 Tax=Mucilaginibacter sp. P4 TaxID=3383180 RepID=UPI0011EFC48B|nr:hypothetical protein [Mucilaginibacter gossypii]QEM15892.1 hypothetical protein DIU38_007045 [Mucilaginibacter gossypii]
MLNDNDDINVMAVAPANKSVGKTYTNLKTYISKNTASTSTGSGSSSSTVTINGVKAKPATLSYSIRSDDDAIVAEGGDVVVTGYGKKANVKAVKVNGMNIVTDGKKDPLVIIDGKTSTLDAFKKMDINTIDSIAVMKSDEGTKKYGDKAKNGVVMISTRKK